VRGNFSGAGTTRTRPELTAHPPALYTVPHRNRPPHSNRRADAASHRHDLVTTDGVNRLIEQLPRALAASAQFDLVPGDDPAQWQITVTLMPADQATLDTLHPSAYQLCAAAQHALGLTALGSQIDPARTVVRVRAGDGLLLAFVGAAALWWLANTPPAALRASIDRLLNLNAEC
jgi:hypothetical protein